MDQIAVVGSLNVDRTLTMSHLPRPGETAAASGRFVAPGGKGANQAVAAALLGADVTLIGAVGDDAEGRMLTEAAAANGVEISAVMTVGEATGEAIIFVDDSAENLIVVNGGANLALDVDHVSERLIGFAVIVCGFEVADEVVEAASEAAVRDDAVFVLNPSPWRVLPDLAWPARTVLVVNEGEYAQASADRSDLHQSAAVIVTKGSRGADVYERGVTVPLMLPPVRVEAVDTSGCGDAFTGALVAALAGGRTLADAARLGVRAGAFAATRRGTQSSYATERDLAGLPEG